MRIRLKYFRRDLEERKPLVKCRRRWENNIEIDLGYSVRSGLDSFCSR
jgi:hypothetical protein